MTPAPPPRSVLFVCGRNTIRSILAHRLCDRHCRRRVFVESAGIAPTDPAGPDAPDTNNTDQATPDPFVEAVLQEVGLSAEGLTPKGLDQVAVDRFALVVSLSPEAHHRLCRDRADPDQPVEYWPVQDPGDIGGSREQQLAGYRLLRDQLAHKIAERFDFTPPGRA